MRIGVAIDGSDHALEALKTAIALSHSMKVPAELILIHVSIDSLASPIARGIDRDQVAAYLDELAQADLDHAAEQAQQSGLRHRVIRAHGPIVETLLNTITQESLDLLVLGHKGRGGLTDLLIGSVTNQMVQLSPVPVVVARKSNTSGA